MAPSGLSGRQWTPPLGSGGKFARKFHFRSRIAPKLTASGPLRPPPTPIAKTEVDFRPRFSPPPQCGGLGGPEDANFGAIRLRKSNLRAILPPEPSGGVHCRPERPLGATTVRGVLGSATWSPKQTQNTVFAILRPNQLISTLTDDVSEHAHRGRMVGSA